MERRTLNRKAKTCVRRFHQGFSLCPTWVYRPAFLSEIFLCLICFGSNLQPDKAFYPTCLAWQILPCSDSQWSFLLLQTVFPSGSPPPVQPFIGFAWMFQSFAFDLELFHKGLRDILTFGLELFHKGMIWPSIYWVEFETVRTEVINNFGQIFILHFLMDLTQRALYKMYIGKITKQYSFNWKGRNYLNAPVGRSILLV